MPGDPRRTAAFLLRSVDYGDSDRILTLLTADFGKVSALARGARKSRRRFAGSLEPYNVIEVALVEGRGELHRLSEAVVVAAFPKILSHLGRITRAGVALELLREALPQGEPVPAVFDLTRTFFEALGADEGEGETLLLVFQSQLLARLGFAPELASCGECGRNAPEGQAALFDPGRGVIVCRACGGASVYLSGGARARWMTSPTISLAETAPWPEKERVEIRTAIDGLVAHHVGRRLAGPAMISQIEAPRRSELP